MVDDDSEDLDWINNDPFAEPVVAIFGELTPVPYSCAACGEQNETQLDLTGGYTQQYTEDCTVCCRPNLLTISVDPETHIVTLGNELEYDC
jgi:hypothetical protein